MKFSTPLDGGERYCAQCYFQLIYVRSYLQHRSYFFETKTEILGNSRKQIMFLNLTI